jgi:threonine dehydrogenase-like Zn-dependent dehydrogenase
VLVLGGGAVGLTTIYWARRMGAGRIVAASRSARRRDMCLAMGADAFVAFGNDEAGEVIEALGGAPQVVYECVGAEGMLAKAIAHAGLYGTVTSLGFCTHADPIVPALGAYKCVTLQFLVGYGLEDFRQTADHLDSGHVDPTAIVTSTIPLAALPATMDLLRGPNAETKVHVLP